MALRFLYFNVFYKKRVFLHQCVKMRGINNVEIAGRLEVGIDYVGFMLPSDKTYLNVLGKLKIQANYSIGRGCRIEIGEGAEVLIGRGGYTNVNCRFVIMHSLSIGDNCVISWGCQFLDDDFHEIIYEGRKETTQTIEIGNDVWIGCGVKVYKGAKIPNGSIVASDSVIKSAFLEENTLIAGNPAKVVKRGVSWK